MKYLMLIIIFTSNTLWASVQCINMFPKTNNHIYTQVSDSAYTTTLIKFIEIYSKENRLSADVYKGLDMELYGQKQTKEKLLYLLKMWPVKGGSQAYIIKAELIDAIASVHGEFNQKHLNILTRELYRILNFYVSPSSAESFLSQLR